MSKFRDGSLGPVVILFAICLVITLALAFVYNLTAPAIAAAEIKAADDARMAVLGGAGSFTKIEADLPDGVTEAYKADNGAGYVFTSEANGFGGAVVYMIGVDAQGGVTGIQVFSHVETPGLGTKVADPDYLANYFGATDPDSVDAVTGATRTTNSLKNALKQARQAFDIVKGAA